MFLLISLPLSKTAPDRDHPYGHGKDRFFWSLIVAVGLFAAAGTVFSVYEGISKLTEGSEEHSSFLAGYIVLGAAFVSRAALVVSSREFRRAAQAESRSFWEHFKVTRNTTMKVPLYEDAAALLGLLIAASGLYATQLTGNGIYDGIASIGIGGVLAFVAWELGCDSRTLLLGEAGLPKTRNVCAT